MLAEVRDAKDAIHLMVLAEAAEVYARKAKLGEESENTARTIKIDAKTMLGQFINQASPLTGGRPKKSVHDGHLSKSLGVNDQIVKEARNLALAKDVAPEVHASVRNGDTPIRDIPRLITPESVEERKERERLQTILITTKEYEYVIDMAALLSGFSKLDPTVGNYRNDPKRKLTPERMRNAGANLLRIARQWSHHEKQKGTSTVRH